MSAVMMILTDAPITRVPGKGEGAQENLVLTAVAALPAMKETAAVMTANVTIVNAMISIVKGAPRGVPFHVHRMMKPQPSRITAGSAVKALSIRKCCAVSVAEETRVYGENACQALFQSRPDAIVRAWFVQSVTPRFKEALRWMAANRKAYHVVDEAELAKASGTEHHGGVCFLIKKRNGTSVAQWVAKADAEDCVLALEDVGNPHNLGAIMRSCAHFGVKGVVVQDAGMLESGAAIRTAEGGAEHVEPITGDSFLDTLEQFRAAGYAIVSTSSHNGTPLYKAELPKKMVLALGQERDGLSDAAISSADLNVAIEGTGNVESLNVSVATGVLLAEWWRQNKA
ncbi:23S rRNA (guanosine-2'-O-)-methyltransferase RlmB [Raoultella terrigena]|uniref:23S rRNA (Guanosine-2'-O-)-methyltransferase RlmB n=1 Tax=Raoultella terrigena TaxID=577 RepID=A0A4V6J1R4_RAOTE|nr:23S rRNA (guanosine-2'-O-)-methyltransferase RlmB [Raoultella terrigena]